jgi:hypothetical protein
MWIIRIERCLADLNVIFHRNGTLHNDRLDSWFDRTIIDSTEVPISIGRTLEPC